MALTTGQVTAFADSVAQAVSDYNTNFVTAPGTTTGVTTINSGFGGTGASNTLGRVLNWLDNTSEKAMISVTNTSVANVAAFLNSAIAFNPYYLQFFPVLDAFDNLLGGLNTYLTTNVLTVNALFANCFNYYQTLAVSMGFRTSATVPTAIAIANFFPYAIVDPELTWSVTGATALTPTAGSATSTKGGGIAPLYIYKVNAVAPAGGAVFTITYTTAAGTSANVQFTTTTGSPGASTTVATGVALNVSAQAVTAVTVTGGTSGENYGVGARLVRASAY